MVGVVINYRSCVAVFIIFCLLSLSSSKEDDTKEEKKEKWKNKDIRDYNDADLERLLDQWEENDEEKLEEDELPEWKRPPPKVDMTQFDPKDPEKTIAESKKGRTLMLFATVAGNPTEKETETISSLWHSSLYNANTDTQRYVVGNNRVIFMLTDGSKAWEVKDFLVQQDNCEEVTIEGKSYPGKGAGKKKVDIPTGKEQMQKDMSENKIKDKSKDKKTSDGEINKKFKKMKGSQKPENIDDNRTGRKKKEEL